MTALRNFLAVARVTIPDELAELPQLAAAMALCLLALAGAWVMLP